jgi:zinc/manganese transport system permease protein
MDHAWNLVFEPGFFSSQPVHTALVVGSVVAVVSAVVGVLTVLRGQSFAGHALSDVGSSGGSASFLVGLSPIAGFVIVSMVAAGIMDLLGIRRPRGRDVSTGIVVGASFGLTALFLYWDSRLNSTTGVSITVLFGSLFVIGSSLVPVILALSLLSVALVVIFYRQLILTSVSEDLATARGVPTRIVGLVYLGALAMSVSLSCLTIGAILSTALLIGPAAASLKLTRSPMAAMFVASGVGLAATWLGVLLAYDSYYWPPKERGWPVSFFVVTLVFAFYLVSDIWSSRRTSDRPEGVRAGEVADVL